MMRSLARLALLLVVGSVLFTAFLGTWVVSVFGMGVVSVFGMGGFYQAMIAFELLPALFGISAAAAVVFLAGAAIAYHPHGCRCTVVRFERRGLQKAA
jgi:hypothetical protein